MKGLFIFCSVISLCFYSLAQDSIEFSEEIIFEGQIQISKRDAHKNTWEKEVHVRHANGMVEVS